MSRGSKGFEVEYSDCTQGEKVDSSQIFKVFKVLKVDYSQLVNADQQANWSRSQGIDQSVRSS